MRRLAPSGSAMDPASWDRDLLGEFSAPAEFGWSSAGRGGAVISAQHPLSALAGAKALECGGTATDAVVAMVATECVVVPGTSSLGGELGAIFRQAGGQVSVLWGGLGVARADHDRYDQVLDPTDGRSVLVPGVVAALEEAWRRFGRLAWADLWAPAVYFAREGFAMYPFYWGNMRRRQAVLLRTPAGRAIFAPDGDLPGPDSTLRQPALAQTMEGLAREGAGHLYRGDWAEKLVAELAGLGGKLSTEDLAGYRPRWMEPIQGSFLGSRLVACPPPMTGGPSLIQGLNLAEALSIQDLPSRDDSAQTLYLEMQIANAADAWLDHFMIDPARASPAERDLQARLLSKEEARRAASQLAEHPPAAGHPEGSHCVAAADAEGNIVAATHTIYSDSWGDTGVMVGGIALNSTGRLQFAVRQPEPGQFLHSYLCGYLIERDGRPAIVASSIGSGLVGCNLQNTINVIARNMTLQDSIARRRWGSPVGSLDTVKPQPSRCIEDFPAPMLDEVERLGQPLARQHDDASTYGDVGFWSAVGVEDDGGSVAVTDPRLTGRALGLPLTVRPTNRWRRARLAFRGWSQRFRGLG